VRRRGEKEAHPSMREVLVETGGPISGGRTKKATSLPSGKEGGEKKGVLQGKGLTQEGILGEEVRREFRRGCPAYGKKQEKGCVVYLIT